MKTPEWLISPWKVKPLPSAAEVDAGIENADDRSGSLLWRKPETDRDYAEVQTWWGAHSPFMRRMVKLAMRAAKNGEDSLTPEEHHELMCWTFFWREDYEEVRA